jgi:hypothetical protein
VNWGSVFTAKNEKKEDGIHSRVQNIDLLCKRKPKGDPPSLLCKIESAAAVISEGYFGECDVAKEGERGCHARKNMLNEF